MYVFIITILIKTHPFYVVRGWPGTRTPPLISSKLVICGCECPNVFLSASMDDAYSVYVVASNGSVCRIVSIERIRCTFLVGCNPPTHSLILNSIIRASDLYTATAKIMDTSLGAE